MAGISTVRFDGNDKGVRITGGVLLLIETSRIFELLRVMIENWVIIQICTNDTFTSSHIKLATPPPFPSVVRVTFCIACRARIIVNL
jgi:hypothetical protein